MILNITLSPDKASRSVHYPISAATTTIEANVDEHLDCHTSAHQSLLTGGQPHKLE